MVSYIAKKAMTTQGQKVCLVIDLLVEALANDPSSSLRRALVLVDIAQNPGTTQSDIMDRIDIHKSALNRDIDWLFNYGCIRLKDSEKDGRLKHIEVYGYSHKAIEDILPYCEESYDNLKFFLKRFITFLKIEKPTLRDAKICATLYEKGNASRQEVLDALYQKPTATDGRAYKKLVTEGIIEDG